MKGICTDLDLAKNVIGSLLLINRKGGYSENEETMSGH